MPRDVTYLAGDVSGAIRAAHPEQALVVPLAVGRAAAAHVFALQHGAARHAREAPRVPLSGTHNRRLLIIAQTFVMFTQKVKRLPNSFRNQYVPISRQISY